MKISRAQFIGHLTSGGALLALAGSGGALEGCNSNITEGTCAIPTFSPNGGSFNSTQSVTISCSTVGATIYYTADGSTPTTGSTEYTGAITVSSSETINAIAVAAGYHISAVGSATFKVIVACATPTFYPAAGTYVSIQTVTISSATSGATIYYTTNGSTPTTSSPQYTGAITVSSTETIQAIATAPSYSESAIGSATYIISGSSATINTWQDQGTVLNSISGQSPGQPNVIYESGAKILAGTVFKMWVGTAIGLCYAESNDGLSWTEYSSNPVISAASHMFPRIFKYNGIYYLYASVLGGSPIAAYTSTDGVTWTLQNPSAITLGSSNAFDGSSIYASGVLGVINGTWYMSYAGYNATVSQTYPAGLATSTDGIHWTKYSGNPIINDGIISANFDFHTVNGIYYGWTQVTMPGIPSYNNEASFGLPSDISRYMAASPTGPWTFLGQSTLYRVLSSEGVGLPTGQVADPALVEVGGNVYLYYSAKSAGQSANNSIINCAIAYSMTIAGLVGSYEGMYDVPFITTGGLVLNLTQTASDNFQRNNANPISGQWTELNTGDSNYTTAQLTSGIVQSNAASKGCSYWYDGVSFNSDQWAQATIAACQANSYVGVTLRASTSNATTCYAVRFYGATGSAGKLSIGRFLNGSYTSISGELTTPVVNVGDVLTASVIGQTVAAYINGDLIAMVTDTIITSGSAGFYLYPISAPNNAAISSFAAGSVNNAPGIVLAGTPTFSPNGGTFASAQNVMISCATSSVAVFYTTDGTVPSMNSTRYMGPITVSSSETIHAIAVATGYNHSAVGSAEFTISEN
jgi:hypothetical protein